MYVRSRYLVSLIIAELQNGRMFFGDTLRKVEPGSDSQNSASLGKLNKSDCNFNDLAAF